MLHICHIDNIAFDLKLDHVVLRDYFTHMVTEVNDLDLVFCDQNQRVAIKYVYIEHLGGRIFVQREQ